MSDTNSIFARLMTVLEDRKTKRPTRSYTTKLMNSGLDAISAKICEEAAEVVDAATVAHEDRGYSLTYEAADLVYHLLVLLAYCGVPLIDVEEELGRRFGKSGLRDKGKDSHPHVDHHHG
jgi:phosphoribosyl-ATP pyrophosphohydrolase